MSNYNLVGALFYNRLCFPPVPRNFSRIINLYKGNSLGSEYACAQKSSTPSSEANNIRAFDLNSGIFNQVWGIQTFYRHFQIRHPRTFSHLSDPFDVQAVNLLYDLFIYLFFFLPWKRLVFSQQ